MPSAAVDVALADSFTDTDSDHLAIALPVGVSDPFAGVCDPFRVPVSCPFSEHVGLWRRPEQQSQQ